MSEQKSVLSGIGTMAVLTISSKLVRLIILMITARFLTPDDFGVVAAFTMVYGFAYLFADMGIVRAIIQRPIISEKHIASALALSVSLSIVIFSVLLFFSHYISSLLTIEAIALPLQISSIMFLLLGVSNICSALLQRNGKILFIGKVQAFGTIFGNLFVTVPLLFWDIGYWSIIIGLWVAELISILFILFQNAKNLHFKVFKQELIEVAKYASAFFFNNSLGLLSQQIDIAIVGRFMGSGSLGNYSRAMQLVEFPNQIYWLVVDRVIFPVMSGMKSEKEKLTDFFLDSLALLSFGLAIGSVILIFGAQEVVLIMMGEQWGMVAELLQIMAGCIIFRALASFMDSFLAAYDLVKVLTIKQVISLFILLISLWLAIDYGVFGIAFAIVIASALRFTLTVIFIVMKTQVTAKKMFMAFLPSILSSILILTIYIISSQFFILSGLAGISVSVIVFLLLSIALPVKALLSNNVMLFIQQLKAKYFNLKSGEL